MKLKPIKVATIFGIPVRISYGWFPVVVLHIYVVSAIYLPVNLGRLHPVEAWVLGAGTTLLLFLSVLGHEVGHALVARAEGIRIRDITLHLFGGFARFERDPASPGAEFRIAVAGPATSFLYAVLFFGLNQVSIYVFDSRPGSLITNYLALSNFILALFNLLPGFPLDGGRVFRAILWHVRGDPLSASRWAIRAGQGIAYTLLGLGGYWIVTAKTSPDIFAGAWSILIGLFLKDAADSSLSAIRHLYAMQDLTVSDVMKPPVCLLPETTLDELISDILPQHKSLTFPVSRDRRLHGIVAMKKLETIPSEEWPNITAREVMSPVNRELFVHPQTLLAEARNLLQDNGLGSAAVLDDDGYIVGYLSLNDLNSTIKTETSRAG